MNNRSHWLYILKNKTLLNKKRKETEDIDKWEDIPMLKGEKNKYHYNGNIPQLTHRCNAIP